MRRRTATSRDRRWWLFVGISSLLLWGCSSVRTARPHLVLEIEPDPVVVRRVWGDLWEIPFEIRLRETAGVDVEIQRVSIQILMGNTAIYNEVLDGSDLLEMGFSAYLQGGATIHHPFRAERFIPNVRLLSNVVAHLTVIGVAADGNRVEASRDVGFAAAAD